MKKSLPFGVQGRLESAYDCLPRENPELREYSFFSASILPSDHVHAMKLKHEDMFL